MKRAPIAVRTRLGQPVRKRVLLCERCGHSWDWHEHSESPVPKAEPQQEQCLKLDCACRGYVGYGPASLLRSA